MLSSTATIASQNSKMNNNDRKRPLSSSIRSSPSPPSAKRHGLSANSRQTTNKIRRRSTQPYRHIDNKSSSSESSRSSSNSTNEDYPSAAIDLQNSNEILSAKKAHLNSNQKSDAIYPKKSKSIALIVKPAATIDPRNLYDSDEELKRTKQILTKSSPVLVPSSVMSIVPPSDLAKKSLMKDNVIVQQLDGNANTSTKLVKLVVPQSAASSSIKMLSSGAGLASALRVPTKIQLTNTSFVSSTKTEQNPSFISSTSNYSINEEQLTFSSSSSTHSLDIPLDLTEKQQSTVDYHSSTSLPPTPPPPVLDKTSSNAQTTDNQQEKISTMDTKTVGETDETGNEQIKSNRHSSPISDWSVPPTSELSPTSLTSSSPDLTHYPLPLDDSLVERDPSINLKENIRHRFRALSSFPNSSPQTTGKLLKSIKSKSLTRLSNSSDTKSLSTDPNRSLASSPIIQLSASKRIKERRRDNENRILHQNSRKKHLKLELNNQLIIQGLLQQIIEQIASTNDMRDNTLKTLLFKPVPPLEQRIIQDVVSHRQGKSPVNKKLYSSSQSVDSTVPNESRSMVMTRKELDELAYLLHANAQQGAYERMDNPTKVEERMREMWSQMSNQKKNSYYKRVIQIYKQPNRDVSITSSSATTETNPISSNDLLDNTVSSMKTLSDQFKRQTSTPLSFHSLPSSTTDESQHESTSKPNIFADIVNELIEGAKGLDKLSCSPTTFANTIDDFVRSSIEKQTQSIADLEQQVEKKCPTQLHRASLFWQQRIIYFASKHQINSSDQSMNELTLIVKYFYLYVLSLNCQKQEAEFESTLRNLVEGNLTFPDPMFVSPVLTSIIEELILPSTLANDYLASQVLIVDQMECSLPWIRNVDLENELLNKNETFSSSNPFVDLNDLEDYLTRCEHIIHTIPAYPIRQSHHPSMYYPSYHPNFPPQYFYSPSVQSSDMNNYYYHPSTAYPNSQQQMYPYNPSPSYYHPSSTYPNNEQLKYYYNQQLLYPYSSQSNSTNDIPSAANNPSIHRTYRSVQRTYSNSQQPPTPTTPAVFDPTTVVVSPQSPSSSSAAAIVA